MLNLTPFKPVIPEGVIASLTTDKHGLIPTHGNSRSMSCKLNLRYSHTAYPGNPHLEVLRPGLNVFGLEHDHLAVYRPFQRDRVAAARLSADVGR